MIIMMVAVGLGYQARKARPTRRDKLLRYIHV
jgi:hypothetical protein